MQLSELIIGGNAEMRWVRCCNDCRVICVAKATHRRYTGSIGGAVSHPRDDASSAPSNIGVVVVVGGASAWLTDTAAGRPLSSVWLIFRPLSQSAGPTQTVADLPSPVRRRRPAATPSYRALKRHRPMGGTVGRLTVAAPLQDSSADTGRATVPSASRRQLGDAVTSSCCCCCCWFDFLVVKRELYCWHYVL